MFNGAIKVLTALLAMGIYTLRSANLLDDADSLVAYTFLLLAYLAGEILNLRLKEGRWDWLNPTVLASLCTFVLSFGVSNILFFLPEEMLESVGVEAIVTPWMNQLMLLVLIAAVAMWSGYGSTIGYELGRITQRSRLFQRWMVTSAQINRHAIFACLLISLAARLLMISLGVYGFSSDYGQLIEGAAYTQYLSLAESLGQLALLGLAIQCFASSRPSRLDRQLLILVLSYEVAFGFLSGFKSLVITPFLIVGVAYYHQHRRFPRWMLPAILIGISLAYAVIEPFRVARYHDASFDGTDVRSIAATMATASGEVGDREEGPSTALSVLARMNLTYVSSKGIEYAAAMKRLPDNSPNFLGDIFLAPLHALIPRLLWEGKPFQNIGLWYTVEVIGYGLEDGILSSTAMGPVTYLNFAGGPIAVVVGFFVIGILQRVAVDGFRPFGGGGIIVFFGLLRLLVMIDSAFNTIFVSLIRLVPLLIIAQYYLLKPARPTPFVAEPVSPFKSGHTYA